MQCQSCNVSAAQHELINSLCHSCTAKRLDRLKSATIHLVAIWRGAVPELEERYQPTNPGQTQIAVIAIEQCANRLEEIITKCTT